MYRIEASTVVERPAQDVWAYLADLNQLKSWDPDVLDVRWTPPARLDQTFTIVVDLISGRPLVGDARIVACEPGRRIWVGGASSGARLGHRWRAESPDSHVHH